MKMPFNHLYQNMKDFYMQLLDTVCKLTSWRADIDVR